MENLKNLIQEAKNDVKKALTEGVLTDLETRWLGRKGRLTEILRNLKNLPERERRVQGAEANRARSELDEMIRVRRVVLRDEAASTELERERIDVTLPGHGLRAGH